MSEVIGGRTMRRLHFLGWSGSELFFLASFSLFVYDRRPTDRYRKTIGAEDKSNDSCN